MFDIDAQAAGLPRFDDVARAYDAILVLSFGGPEGVDDVIPFLENVTRGRGVPPERLAVSRMVSSIFASQNLS